MQVLTRERAPDDCLEQIYPESAAFVYSKDSQGKFALERVTISAHLLYHDSSLRLSAQQPFQISSQVHKQCAHLLPFDQNYHCKQKDS